MGIIITSDIAKQYLLTEDAVEGFNTAVENGQIRLALQIMAELVDGIMQVLDYIVEDNEDESEDSNKKIEPVEVVVESKKEIETTTSKKTVAKEPVSKEEKSAIKTEAE
jgi:hypothetical protein